MDMHSYCASQVQREGILPDSISLLAGWNGLRQGVDMQPQQLIATRKADRKQITTEIDTTYDVCKQQTSMGHANCLPR